jgi:Na+/alanine symporter
MFREMIRLLFSSKESDRGISSFQALAVSLSGRVGTGNIAGVAAAIGFGGPGAVFWMWMVAFLGSATAYIESALGQIYKMVCMDFRHRDHFRLRCSSARCAIEQYRQCVEPRGGWRDDDRISR